MSELFDCQSRIFHVSCVDPLNPFDCLCSSPYSFVSWSVAVAEGGRKAEAMALTLLFCDKYLDCYKDAKITIHAKDFSTININCAYNGSYTVSSCTKIRYYQLRLIFRPT